MVLALLLIGMGMLMAKGLFMPGAGAAPFEAIVNPIGVPGTRELLRAVDTVGWILVVAGIALSATALIVRLRRSHGIERQQLSGVVTETMQPAHASLWLREARS